MQRPTVLTIAFLVLALPTALVLALLTPPGLVPDETAHISRAGALLQGDLIPRRRPVLTLSGDTVRLDGVRVDPALIWVPARMLALGSRTPLTAATLQELRAFAWNGTRYFTPMGSIALYMPALYVPGAIGLAVARAAGGSPYDAIRAGRLVNLLAFMLLGVAVLETAQRGRALMFCALTCPMTLSLAGSMNQDGLLVAASLLAAALVTAGRRTPAAFLVAAIAMVKLPYAALAVLLLGPRRPPGASRRSRPRLVGRLGLPLLTLVPGLLWTAWMLAAFASPNIRDAYTPGPLWPGDPTRVFATTDVAAQLAVLRAAPAHVLALPLVQLWHDHALVHEAIGVLGLLDVPLPGILYRIWYAALALAVLADLLQGQPGPSWPETLLYAAAGLACTYVLYLSLYLTWTDVGMDRIDGMQGRYLLPLVPLAALMLPRIDIPGGARLSALCRLAPMAVALAGAVTIPFLVVGTWYLR